MEEWTVGTSTETVLKVRLTRIQVSAVCSWSIEHSNTPSMSTPKVGPSTWQQASRNISQALLSKQAPNSFFNRSFDPQIPQHPPTPKSPKHSEPQDTRALYKDLTQVVKSAAARIRQPDNPSSRKSSAVNEPRSQFKVVIPFTPPPRAMDLVHIVIEDDDDDATDATVHNVPNSIAEGASTQPSTAKLNFKERLDDTAELKHQRHDSSYQNNFESTAAHQTLHNGFADASSSQVALHASPSLWPQARVAAQTSNQNVNGFPRNAPSSVVDEHPWLDMSSSMFHRDQYAASRSYPNPPNLKQYLSHLDQPQQGYNVPPNVQQLSILLPKSEYGQVIDLTADDQPAARTHIPGLDFLQSMQDRAMGTAVGGNGLAEPPRKRYRRRVDEIEGNFKCTWPGCDKAYGSVSTLSTHIEQQSHGERRTVDEFSTGGPYKCGWRGCQNAYDNLHTLNTHITIAAHGETKTPRMFSGIVKHSPRKVSATMEDSGGGLSNTLQTDKLAHTNAVAIAGQRNFGGSQKPPQPSTAFRQNRVLISQRSNWVDPSQTHPPGNFTPLKDFGHPLKNFPGIVQPLDYRKTRNVTGYDPRTIARSVLETTHEKGLNSGLRGLMQAFSAVDENSDLSTIRWDLVDPPAPAAPPPILPGATVVNHGPPLSYGQQPPISAEEQPIMPPTSPNSSQSLQFYGSQPSRPTNPTPARPSSLRQVSRPASPLSTPQAVNFAHRQPFNATPSQNALPSKSFTKPRSRASCSNSAAPVTASKFMIEICSPSGSVKSDSFAKQRGRPSKNIASPKNIAVPSAPAIKKRGRPFTVPEAAAATAAKAQATPDGTFVKKPGRPAVNKASDMKDVKLTPPKFHIWRCEWFGCNAELHNLETLRAHVLSIHTVARQDSSLTCLWKNCGRHPAEELDKMDVDCNVAKKRPAIKGGDTLKYPKNYFKTLKNVRGPLPADSWSEESEEDKTVANEQGIAADHTLERLVFKSLAEWSIHIEKVHLMPYAWHMGDGPRATLSPAPSSVASQKPTSQRAALGKSVELKKPAPQQEAPWLFNASGKQIIASIRGQAVEDGKANNNNEKRFEKVREGVHLVLKPVKNPEAYKAYDYKREGNK
ncbi:hypothetical protein BJ878DRAFT_487159 [Calycina marina]|uniref:C2H2-type domain-containing protein n=1 Tax=Calycina marina TaxID=1763456 RepID=A0A9P8CJ57_9HELO|nr:hypothetical protein BJ878DRAFT_487159 [Calycina marina]